MSSSSSSSAAGLLGLGAAGGAAAFFAVSDPEVAAGATGLVGDLSLPRAAMGSSPPNIETAPAGFFRRTGSGVGGGDSLLVSSSG